MARAVARNVGDAAVTLWFGACDEPFTFRVRLPTGEAFPVPDGTCPRE